MNCCISIGNVFIITKMGQNKVIDNTGPGIAADRQTDRQTDSGVCNIDPDSIKNYKWPYKTC
jgi:hypothetical protein